MADEFQQYTLEIKIENERDSYLVNQALRYFRSVEFPESARGHTWTIEEYDEFSKSFDKLTNAVQEAWDSSGNF